MSDEMPPPPPPPAGGAKDEKMWATILHLSAIFCIPALLPFVIWTMKKEESAMVDEHGKAAINFQIIVSIYFIASMVLAFIPFVGILISLLSIIVWIGNIVICVMAAIKANQGELFPYPKIYEFMK